MYNQEPKSGTLNFSSFRSSFTSNVNYLKRRFSSGDLSSECDETDPNLPPPTSPATSTGTPATTAPAPAPAQTATTVAPVSAISKPAAPLQQQPMPQGGPPNLPPPPAPSQPTPVSATGGAPELSLSFGKGSTRGTSAPSSPAKSRESLLQRVQSLTGAARDQGASIIGAAVSSATRPTFNKDRCFTLMVIDDQNTDWSKYFRGKRLHGDYDIRVEQAEFREISLTANGDSGAIISMAVYRNGTKVARSFRPDFVLIRQPPRDGARDQRSSLLGLKYGGVPSINSLTSLYQFQDKPWVFAHLLQLQRRLGREQFPLIEQTFLPNPRELFSWQKFPCVLKAGHCHGGTATARLDNQGALQDAAGLLCGSSAQETGCYCSVEPYIDAKFDVHIQKIGGNYKAFMRKSISGNWKTNQGSAMLESIPVTEKYKTWIDEISRLSRIGGRSKTVDGGKLIYKIIDYLFEPELMLKYSWTGSSKSREQKFSFQKYSQIIDVIFEVIYMADCRHSKARNEEFLRDKILKHTLQRLQRKRKSEVKSQKSNEMLPDKENENPTNIDHEVHTDDGDVETFLPGKRAK